MFLPALGVERSFFLIAVLYGGIGVLLCSETRAHRANQPIRRRRRCSLSLALFPFGTMQTRLSRTAVRPWLQAIQRAHGRRPGRPDRDRHLFQRQMLGRPVSYAMLTNAFSMSATGYGARRYMKLYVYWPMAVHPNLKRALLIGYGVGNTAKAMTDSTSLETIDVVDLSRDILEMSARRLSGRGRPSAQRPARARPHRGWPLSAADDRPALRPDHGRTAASRHCRRREPLHA